MLYYISVDLIFTRFFYGVECMRKTSECLKFVERLYKAYPIGNEYYEELLNCTKMYLGTYEQIKWERDMAIKQLEDAGMEFEKKYAERGKKL